MLPMHQHLVTTFLFMSGLGGCWGDILTARVGDNVLLQFPAARPYREVRFFDPLTQEFAVFSQGKILTHLQSKIEFAGFESVRSFQFLVKKVTVLDAGTYTCAAGSVPRSETLIPGCNVTIIILQQPTMPILSASHLSPALGESVTLTCHSQSTSVPFARALHFEWREDNHVILKAPNSDLYVIREVKAEHWGKSYTCQARDETGPFSETSNPVRLNVLCDPLVAEIPTHFTAEPFQALQVSFNLPVMEKDASLDVMSPRCTRVVSLPENGAPPRLESQFKGRVMESSLHLENLTLTFNFNMVTPDLAGTYSCRIKAFLTNRLSRLCGFVLHVEEPLPKPILRQVPGFSPGETAVRCLVAWTPFPPDLRKLEYSFQVDGEGYDSHPDMEEYLVVHLEGGHHNLRCKSHFGDQTSPQSDMLSIVVPDAPPYLIMNQSSPVFVVRGRQEAVLVECQASCQGCQGQWTFHGSKFWPHIKGSLLVLLNLTSAHEGKYVCIGEKIPPTLPRPDPLTLEVRLTDPPFANFTINGHSWTEVNRSDSVTLRCEGRGLPLPRVVILPRHGVPLFQRQGGQPLEYEAREQWSLAEARIEHAECSHGGEFLCLMFGDKQLPYTRPLGYSSATLRVNCEPRLEAPPPSTFPIALLSGQWLSVEVKAYPWPSFTWYHGGLGAKTLACSNVTSPERTRAASGDGPEGTPRTSEVLAPFVQHDDACCQKIDSYYRILNATVSDLGIYTVDVENKLGFLSFSVEVIPEGPPDPPTGVTCLEKSQSKSSVTVSWSPACASRHPNQTFLLTFQNLKPPSSRSTNGTPGFSLSWTLNVTGRAKIIRTVAGLKSGSTYSLSLAAQNEHGRSQPVTIYCSTLDYPVREYALLVGAVTVLALFLVVLVLVLANNVFK